MKHLRKQAKIRQSVTALVTGIFLLGLVPGTSCAEMVFKKALKFQQKFGTQIMLDQSLMNVNVPLDIANMPGPWKNAKFKAVAVVYFLDAASEPVGYGASGSLEEGTPIDVTLANGSYSGTVVFPIKAAAGTITGKTCCVVMLVAELGNQRMFIGTSRGGTAPNSYDSILNIDIPPGTVY